MIVNPDHMSQAGVDATLKLLEARGYSGVISPHGWMDPGNWPRLWKLGGLAWPGHSKADEYVNEWKALRPKSTPYDVRLGLRRRSRRALRAAGGAGGADATRSRASTAASRSTARRPATARSTTRPRASRTTGSTPTGSPTCAASAARVAQGPLGRRRGVPGDVGARRRRAGSGLRTSTRRRAGSGATLDVDASAARASRSSATATWGWCVPAAAPTSRCFGRDGRVDARRQHGARAVGGGCAGRAADERFGHAGSRACGVCRAGWTRGGGGARGERASADVARAGDAVGGGAVRRRARRCAVSRPRACRDGLGVVGRGVDSALRVAQPRRDNGS